MMNYVGKELRTALHKRYTLFYIIGLLALCVLANLSIIFFREFFHYAEDAGADAYNLLIYAEGIFWIPYYSVIFIADIIFGKVYPNPKIRDKYTIGMNRVKIYFGKFFAELILGFIFAAIAVGGFLGVTYLFSLAQEQAINLMTVMDFLQKVAVAAPLWIAGVAMANMFMFVFDRKRYAFLAFAGVVILFPRLIMTFAAQPFEWPVFVAVQQILITPEFNALQFFHTQNIPKDWLLGAVYTVLATVTGVIAFQKKEF